MPICVKKTRPLVRKKKFFSLDIIFVQVWGENLDYVIVQVSQAMQYFQDHLKLEKGASTHTVSAYSRDLGQMLDHLQGQGLSEVDGVLSINLKAFCQHLRETNLEARSYNRKLSAMRSFFGFCQRQGWISTDPTQELKNLRTQPKSPEPIGEEDMAKVLEVTSDGVLGLRDRALMELLYSTGLRVSEVVDLTMDQFSEENTSLRVMGKGKKERTVFLTESAQEWMKRYLTEGRVQLSPEEDNKMVFINHRGGALTVRSVQRMVRRRTLAAGIQQRLTPHGVRHSVATHLLNHGFDLRQLQELLGHESLSSTQVYTHLSVPRLKQVHALSHPRSAETEAI